MKIKRLAALFLACSMVGLTACSSQTATTPSSSASAGKGEDVSLVMWGSEEDQSLLQDMVNAFIAENADKANISVTLGVQSESNCKDSVLNDVEAAADVFAFADDQINELVKGGALQAIPDNMGAQDVQSRNLESSVKAATLDGKLYAYPMTADNGYFMFYDKQYFTDTDVQSMDAMLAAAKKAGKQISMRLDDGWYLYSFFAGAGLKLSLNDDGTNSCNWNATDTPITGVDVAKAILDIASNKAFISLSDDAFASSIKDGSVIAGVSGTWNAQVASDTWGENYAASKLPTYTVNGNQVQMSSFAGYKLVGVNAYSKNVGWAMKLADYITNEKNQIQRFEKRGLGPSNKKASESQQVQSAPAIAALAEQAPFSTVQRVSGNYWAPVQTFGAILAGGNAGGEDEQKLLDNLVQGVEAPVS